MPERNPAARIARAKVAAEARKYEAEYQRAKAQAKINKAKGIKYQTELCEWSDDPYAVPRPICGKPRTKLVYDPFDPAEAPFPYCDEHFAKIWNEQMQAEAMVTAGMKPKVILPNGEEIYDPDDFEGEN